VFHPAASAHLLGDNGFMKEYVTFLKSGATGGTGTVRAFKFTFACISFLSGNFPELYPEKRGHRHILATFKKNCFCQIPVFIQEPWGSPA
jgi:hypothetical protein